MIVKGSADILECVLDFEEADERNLNNSEKTVKAEHKAERNCQQALEPASPIIIVLGSELNQR